MMMPSRSYSAQSGYRYGFNGKENDNEVKGEGNQVNYGDRIFDNRLGRFLSVDPLQTQFPWFTPYQFAGNSPIQNIDLDGLETFHYDLGIDDKTGKSKLTVTSVEHGSLCDLLTVQKVNYKGGVYTIDAEWNYPPYHGFTSVAELYGKTQAQLDEYFKNRKTDSQVQEEQRQKDEHLYRTTGAVVFGGVALNKQQAAQKSSPESSTNKTAIAANNGNKNATTENTATTTQVQQPSQNRGVDQTLENVSKRKALPQAYEDATEGAASDVRSRKRIVPTLKYDNPNPNGKNYVKFDGYEVESKTLIDRKWSVTTFEKSLNQIRRMSEALRQNPGYKGVIEVPTKKAYNNAVRAVQKSGATNITVRIANP